MKKKRKFGRLFRFLGFLMLVFCLTFFLSGGLNIFHPRTWQGVGDFLPREEKELPSNAREGEPAEPDLSDRISRVIFLKRAVNRHIRQETYVTIDRISPDLQHAIIAVEDNRFYSHHGFDPEGIARASLVNLQYGQIEEGASTITQQLVKNLFLSQERSFGRKAEELMLSLAMEANYSKDEILALYLNTIYFGSNFYGIHDASKGYFDKNAAELSLAEAAMLAGLPNAPSLYSPYVDFLMAKKRQFIVLDAMTRYGYISREDAEDAKIRPIYLAHD
ncbi:MAG: transglycosylase domain-containing protein [Selenomonadaceae bacterium]|nr:transglycosylase domain-containing protein [Selenomonadaceae bacterium]